MLHNQSACLPVSHIVNFSFFPPTVRNLILKSTPGNKCETEVSRHAVGLDKSMTHHKHAEKD